MSEVYRLIKQISRNNYSTENHFLEKVEYIVEDHFDNYKNQFQDIKDVFLKYERDEIITGDIMNFWDHNVVLNFDTIEFDNPETITESVKKIYNSIKEDEEYKGCNIVITLTSYLFSDLEISF